MAFIQHIDDITYDQFCKLTYVQQELLNALMDSEIGFGFWFYDEWATAIHQDLDGSEVFWQIDIDLPWREARDFLWTKVYSKVREQTFCHCYHDCCGHSFLSGVNVAKLYEEQHGYKSYIMRDRWGVNV